MITLEERIRLNGGGGINREQAQLIGYDPAEIDRLLPAEGGGDAHQP